MAKTYEQVLPAAMRPAHSARSKIWSWITTVDHKQIGILYLYTALAFFLIGGIYALIIRLQLLAPNQRLISAQLFNQLFTMHGTTMIFLAAMPLTAAFMNYFLPLLIGARDVAFPRLNALSYWLFLAGALILTSSWFLGGGPDAGWFNYVPISGIHYSPGHGIDFYDMGIQISGLGTTISAINFLVTIFNLRAPGMTLMRMPLFVWTVLVTSVLIVFSFPALTIDLLLQQLDRLFGAQFFAVPSGGSPLLWSNLFWIFGHPEVYIVVMPAFGMISEVIPVFSKKPLFGYASMVLSTMAIGFLAFTVWIHHMFTMDYGAWVNSIFGLTSMLIAIPTGVKIFSWIATMWEGRVRLTTAMLWALGFLITFTIGGVTGVMLAVSPADLQYNDSYFVVSHFHYTLIGGVIFGTFAGIYYWWPKMFGRFLDERLGKWNFWLMFLGFHLTFLPMAFMGLLGMPRRIYTYMPGLGLHTLNVLSTVGSWVLGVGVLLFVLNVARTWRSGTVAGQDPWDGRTLEWALPSPVPVYNFEKIPLVRGRDPLWVEKMYGNGTLLPAPEPDSEHAAPPGQIHMPEPTAVPAAMALCLMVFGYAVIYRSLVVAIIGGGGVLITLYQSMFRPDHGMYVPIAAEKGVDIHG